MRRATYINLQKIAGDGAWSDIKRLGTRLLNNSTSPAALFGSGPEPEDIAAWSNAVGSVANSKIGEKPNPAFSANAGFLSRNLGLPLHYGLGWRRITTRGEQPMCNALTQDILSSALKRPDVMVKRTGHTMRVKDLKNAIDNNYGMISDDTRLVEIPRSSAENTSGAIPIDETHVGVMTNDGRTAHASYEQGAVKNRWGYSDHPKTKPNTKHFLAVHKDVPASWARQYAASPKRNGSYIPVTAKDLDAYAKNSPRFRRMPADEQAAFRYKALSPDKR